MYDTFAGDPLTELPAGLAMALAKNPSSLDAFARLPDREKATIVARIQSAQTSDEVKELIRAAVEGMR